MNEKQISKISLLLLINEIINLNIKLVKDNILDIESIDNDGNNYLNDNLHDQIKHTSEENNQFNNNEIIKNAQNYNNKNDNSRKYKNNWKWVDDDNNYINVLSKRLKDMGKSIGLKLIERILIYKNNLIDIKDIIKIIGKDMWFIIFNKNIDKLQTYKKNVYIIIDNDISVYLKHTLIDNKTNQKNNFIHAFIILIIGIIKGVLIRFKINAYVTYNLNYPTCSFQITILDG
ncbi:trafficking protein particle complex subunit 6A, putative [Plasmodium berghei]|nr:trafficking protein particle complex subunit 6A, putative [Plasmodium berghei]